MQTICVSIMCTVANMNYDFFCHLISKWKKKQVWTTGLKVRNNRYNQSASKNIITEILRICLVAGHMIITGNFTSQLSLRHADRHLTNEQWGHVLINHLTNPILNYRPEKVFGRHFPRTWCAMGGGEAKEAVPTTLVTNSLLPEHSSI